MRSAILILTTAAFVLAIVASVTVQSDTDSAGAAGGGTITTPDTIGDVGRYASLALDSSGNPVVSYYDATNDQLKVLHCGDTSCSSGNSIETPDTGGGSFTSLALDAAGNPVVAYIGTGGLRLLQCGDETCSSGNSIALVDGANQRRTSLTLDGLGNPVISYAKLIGFDLYMSVVHCGNPTCTAGNTFSASLPDCSNRCDSSIALDGAGDSVLAYTTDESQRVVHCGDAACSASNVTNWSGTLAKSFSYVEMVLDGSGRPVLAFHDQLPGRNGDLKLVFCGDTDCASGNVRATPDNGERTGRGPSIALDGSGFPVVSYAQTATGPDQLKVVHCGDAMCSSGNSIEAVDASISVEQDFSTSLVLDASGYPVVSYYDAINDDLKVLYCGNEDCTGKSIAALPTEEPDSDFDGCTDAAELGPDEKAGGQRDPNSFWDFYDVSDGDTGNPEGVVGLFQDIFAVAFRFGATGDPSGDPNTPPDDATGYHTRFDRSAPELGMDPWDMGAPDGTIDLFIDIFGVAYQFGHACQ